MRWSLSAPNGGVLDDHDAQSAAPHRPCPQHRDAQTEVEVGRAEVRPGGGRIEHQQGGHDPSDQDRVRRGEAEMAEKMRGLRQHNVDLARIVGTVMMSVRNQ